MSRVALAVVEGCGLLGLRRLFRQPYSGPICVIEIVGVELKPSANCGTACSLYPAAPRPSVCCATRRATRRAARRAAPLDEPLSRRTCA